LPEVLRLEVPTGSVHALAAPSAVLDPLTRRLVDAEVARARDEARHEGEAAGRAAAADAAAGAVAAVRSAVDEVHAQLAADRRAATAASLELALRLASAVLDATPPDPATVVLDRVREAVDLLDGDRLEVRVRPEHHAVLAAGLDDPRLEVVADPTLPPGGARLRGADGGAELTRSALLAAAAELLDGGDA
jgi:flagellar biosynthesis/type III secretory pathway protein FliH